MIPFETENIRIMLEAGYLYMAMKRFKEAREIFEGVSLLVPTSEVPVVALGNVSFVESKFEEAIKIYKKALEIVPDSAFAKAYLGEAYFFGQKKEEAIQYLEESSRLDGAGKTGEFSRSLLDLIRKGFNPNETAQQK